MGKQPFISHTVNGYSRYDLPESKAFSCTGGILYPVRIDFINARDRVSIEQGIDVRSNPLAVPVFNPYTIRLHRFWVPLQLYHPEMRTNSSLFDMNNLSINWIPSYIAGASTLQQPFGLNSAASNSLMSWLRVMNSPRPAEYSWTQYNGVNLPEPSSDNCYYGGAWANADTYLAYWDIVRNYYSYSQWSSYSFAWPCSWSLVATSGDGSSFTFNYNNDSKSTFFQQRYGNLQYLDAFYESQFYPSAVESDNNTFNRSNLFSQIIYSDFYSTRAGDPTPNGDGYPVSVRYASNADKVGGYSPSSPYVVSSAGQTDNTALNLVDYFTCVHPMAVVPASPDRFSRLLPAGDSQSAVSMSGVATIPQLAVASRLQEYKDLLGAGGSRFSDWLETFFASKIDHVDRPKLLFAASVTVNVQVVMNQSGYSNFGDENASPLGAQGGSIAFNSRLGRRQSYYFKEPGYMIDMLSIRPVYYWTGIRPDYLDYEGADYFNPIYNDIGYQDVSAIRLGAWSEGVSIAQEPCFNEFRSSYDEVLGQLSYFGSPVQEDEDGNVSNIIPIYSYWVQQRSQNYIDSNTAVGRAPAYSAYIMFTNLSTVNAPFASDMEDNFFVNMSYSVRKKNLVNKTFATRLSNR